MDAAEEEEEEEGGRESKVKERVGGESKDKAVQALA